MGVGARLLVVLVACLIAASSRAQVSPGVGGDAMQQLATVGVAHVKAGTWGVATTAGFGVLSPDADADSHQRFTGSLAGSLGLMEGVAVGLRLDGRYDLHPDDAQGSDDSLVGEPTLRVRLATPLSETFHLGLDLSLMVPGKDAPSFAIGAARTDARVLATYSSTSGVGVTSQIGFRLDRSGEAAPTLATTRPGDRLSLGLNDFNAILLGLGAWKRFDTLELLTEVTWNPWLGSGAPSAFQSPLHLVAGARYMASDNFALELLVDGRLSQRPEPDAQKLATLDPTIAVQIGLRLFGGYAPPPVIDPEPTIEPEPIVEPEAPAVTAATVRGRVVDKDGQPVAGAAITIVGDNYERSAESAEDGAYEVTDVPLGTATLRITGRRLQPSEQPLEVVAAGVALDLQPERLPAQGILRGLVRSFDGKPLAATITIDGAGESLTADAEGEFEAALPPGDHEVRISIAGYGQQTRTVQIEDDGVTLLNVDLKKGRR